MNSEDIRRSYLHGYSKLELISIVLTAQEKAKECHLRARKAELKLTATEAELALYRARERQENQ